jgi:hypothetical protein
MKFIKFFGVTKLLFLYSFLFFFEAFRNPFFIVINFIIFASIITYKVYEIEILETLLERQFSTSDGFFMIIEDQTQTLASIFRKIKESHPGIDLEELNRIVIANTAIINQVKLIQNEKEHNQKR